MVAPGDRSARLSRWLIQHRVAVLVVAALLAVLAGYRTVLTYADLRSDLEELLPDTAPSVQALEVARTRLPGLRHLGIVVDTGGPQNVPQAQRFIDDLAKRIQKYPPGLVGAVRADLKPERQFGETYALQLVDPADVQRLRKAVEKRRDWDVTRAMDLDLLDEEEEPPPEVPIAELRDKYEARYGKPREFPDDRFVSEDGKTAVLLVQASSTATSYDDDKALLSRVQRDVKDLGFPDAYAPEMRVGYAADVAAKVEEMEGLVVDLGLSGAMVLLLVVGVLVAYFRSWRALPILGIPLVFGTLYAFGVAALPPWSIRHLNSNTAFLGSIVVGNGINSGIMLLARFREERQRGAELEDAIALALGAMWRPTLAAALAASAAYGSLVFTDFRGFNQFGWIGGFGMVLCWGSAMLLGPPLMWILGRHMQVGSRSSGKSGPGQRLLGAMVRRPRTLLLATLVLTVAAIVGMTRRTGDWIEYDLSRLRRMDSWVSGERYWGGRMNDTLGRYLTPTVVMTKGPEQATLVEQRIRKLKRQGKAGQLIADVRSIATVLPSSRADSVTEARKLKEVLTPKLMGELEPDDRRLVERALSDAALEPLSADQVPDVLVAGLRENDGRIDRNVLVFPKLTEGTWDAERIGDYSRDLRRAATFGDERAPVAGALPLAADIARAMQADGPRATMLALLAVLVISVLAFRSLGLSLAAVASLFVGVALMLGAMAWLGEKLNFSNFVALPITFGIGADYSINMLKRFQSKGGLDAKSALAATGGAVALCSATTIIGFGSLLVAQNRALFSFGLFAVAGEFACLATAVLALPAALRLRGGQALDDSGA